MRNIEVAVIGEHGYAPGWTLFLARLTQRGHSIKNMGDLKKEYEKSVGIAVDKPKLIEAIAKLPHGTIKRFTPITVAIVGASRRFLAQARTHQVGLTYVSASLQYSDYSGEADFVVPYPLIEYDNEHADDIDITASDSMIQRYLDNCKDAMTAYKILAESTDNDTAGYAAPQGLRNILIIQGNHESWMNFINRRACNRNTLETQYVTLRIWEELLKTDGGQEMFKYAGPDCTHGICREGKMCCGKPMRQPSPTDMINERFPLLRR